MVIRPKGFPEELIYISKVTFPLHIMHAAFLVFHVSKFAHLLPRPDP